MATAHRTRQLASCCASQGFVAMSSHPCIVPFCTGGRGGAGGTEEGAWAARRVRLRRSTRVIVSYVPRSHATRQAWTAKHGSFTTKGRCWGNQRG